MNKYRKWEIVETMPDGWIVDVYTGSPLAGHVFITNGKSPLKGQERALLKVEPKRDKNTPKNDIPKGNHFVEANRMIEKTEIPIFPAKSFRLV